MSKLVIPNSYHLIVSVNFVVFEEIQRFLTVFNYLDLSTVFGIVSALN